MNALLTDPWFEAGFVSGVTAAKGESFCHGLVHTVAEAQGVKLWCPCTYGKPLGDDAHTHGLIIPFADRGLPESFGPRNSANPDGPRPRWKASGTTLADLTITPSVDVGHDSCWHGFISAGRVT